MEAGSWFAVLGHMSGGCLFVMIPRRASAKDKKVAVKRKGKEKLSLQLNPFG